MQKKKKKGFSPLRGTYGAASVKVYVALVSSLRTLGGTRRDA